MMAVDWALTMQSHRSAPAQGRAAPLSDADSIAAGVRTITIEFPDNKAQAAFGGPDVGPEALAEALGLARPRPVFLVIGGAGTLPHAGEPALMRFFEWGVVPAAATLGATLVDGGTQSGVMKVLGRATAASGPRPALVGVAPAGRVTFPGDDPQRPHGDTQLEPNHSAFVLANSDEWGGERRMLFGIATVVAGSEPIVAILAGGGEGALDEVRSAVRRRIPIVIIEGTGGKADEIVAAVRWPTDQDAAAPLAGILGAADMTIVSFDSEPADFEGVLARFLGPDDILREAWRLQKLMSRAAGRQQSGFRGSQNLILLLGLLVTTLVVVQSVIDDYAILATAPQWVNPALYVLIILLPITGTALAAATGRFRPGSRWILLRGASEAIKREIYRYRARAGIYSPAETRSMSREVKLAEAIGSTLGGLMRSDVSQLGFDVSSEQLSVPDDKLTPLSAKSYVDDRVSGQIKYYTETAGKLERQARRLRALAIAFGAVGTFLAAVGLQIWVAVTTSVVAIFTTVVESRQLETSVTFYNQAAADLTSIRTWWRALPEPERETQATIDRLVERAERILRAENVGWVQEMQDAMTQFRLEQASDEASAKAPSGSETPDGSTQPAEATLHPPAAGGVPTPGPATQARGPASTKTPAPKKTPVPKPASAPRSSPSSAVSTSGDSRDPTTTRSRSATASPAPSDTTPRALDAQPATSPAAATPVEATSENVDSADASDGQGPGDRIGPPKDDEV